MGSLKLLEAFCMHVPWMNYHNEWQGQFVCCKNGHPIIVLEGLADCTTFGFGMSQFIYFWNHE
jgi:hypothetical protein